MKSFRIKHLPSGLYFIPSREIKIKLGSDTHLVKSNLSIKGKIYLNPSVKFIGDGIYTHLVSSVKELDKNGNKFISSSINDWIIEEII